MSRVSSFIKSIKEEKDGFSFDRPWRLDKDSLGVIIPILRKSKKKRDYITLAEANKIKVEDTGQIDHVYIRNDEDKPVYVSRGEIFRGKTQERTAIHGYVIMPRQGLRVAVRCVHQTKGIRAKADMKYGGRTPYAVDLSSQGNTWRSIHVYSSNVCRTKDNPSIGGSKSSPVFRASLDHEMGESASFFSMPASDDLVNTISDLSGSIKEVMKRIPFVENQVGAMFFKENSLVGMDVYDLAASWDAVKRDVVEKEGSNFLEKDSKDMFELKPEKAKGLAQEKLSAKFEEKDIYDKEYSVIELRSEKALGEAVIFKGKVIHLTLWKK